MPKMLSEVKSQISGTLRGLKGNTVVVTGGDGKYVAQISSNILDLTGGLASLMKWAKPVTGRTANDALHGYIKASGKINIPIINAVIAIEGKPVVVKKLKKLSWQKESNGLRQRGYMAEAGYVLAESMPIGKIIETPILRVHRYASGFTVTDLKNAGQRGKTVDEFALYDLDYVKDPKTLHMIDQFASQIYKAKTYKQARAMAMSVVDQSQKTGRGRAGITDHNPLKGVDVAPYGKEKVVIDTPDISIRSEINNFLIADKRDKMNEPRTMGPMTGRKTAAKKFRSWVNKNRAAIERMDYNQVLKAIRKAGIDSHSWCAMD